LLIGGSVALPVQCAGAQSSVDPWDVSWLPTARSDKRALDQAIDVLLKGTGLNGQGQTIRRNAQRHRVNPAFALAMFRKEAGFAARGTLAHRNKNPINMVATGACWGEPKGTRCKGVYGEIGTDGRFGRYATIADGIKAFFVLMEREYAGMTLHALISRACPPIECDVPAYVAQMETWTLEYQSLLIGALYKQPGSEGAGLDDDESPFWRHGPAKSAPSPPAQIEPDAPQASSDSNPPVLFEHLWRTGKRLFPLCCGSGALRLVFAVLAFVFWDRLPTSHRGDPAADRDPQEPL